jgi:hypothetical protein
MLLLDSVSKLSSSASGKLDVLVLGELIATDAIVALNGHVTHRAVVAVLNAGAALRVQQMKGDALVFGGGVELNGN